MRDCPQLTIVIIDMASSNVQRISELLNDLNRLDRDKGFREMAIDDLEDASLAEQNLADAKEEGFETVEAFRDAEKKRLITINQELRVVQDALIQYWDALTQQERMGELVAEMDRLKREDKLRILGENRLLGLADYIETWKSRRRQEAVDALPERTQGEGRWN